MLIKYLFRHHNEKSLPTL